MILRGELIAAIEFAQLDDFFHRFGLRAPLARARVSKTNKRRCARRAASGMKIMNFVDIERRLLRDEEEDEEEDENDDAFHDDDDEDDA